MRQFANSSGGFRELKTFWRQWRPRTWAVEGCNGVGVAGVYTFEVAEMKVRQVEAEAREREFPLMLSIEPEE